MARCSAGSIRMWDVPKRRTIVSANSTDFVGDGQQRDAVVDEPSAHASVLKLDFADSSTLVRSVYPRPPSSAAFRTMLMRVSAMAKFQPATGRSRSDVGSAPRSLCCEVILQHVYTRQGSRYSLVSHDILSELSSPSPSWLSIAPCAHDRGWRGTHPPLCRATLIAIAVHPSPPSRVCTCPGASDRSRQR